MESFRECPICFFEYDLGRNRPVVLPWCGHTACKECIEANLKDGSLVCALCNQRGELYLDKLIINYSLLSMLDVKQPTPPPKSVDVKKSRLTEMCMHKIAFIKGRKDRLHQGIIQAESDVARCEAAMIDFGFSLRSYLDEMEGKTTALIEAVRNSNASKAGSELQQVEEDLDYYQGLMRSLEQMDFNSQDPEGVGIIQQLKKPLNYNYEVSLDTLSIDREEELQTATELLAGVELTKKLVSLEFETFDGYLVNDLEAQLSVPRADIQRVYPGDMLEEVKQNPSSDAKIALEGSYETTAKGKKKKKRRKKKQNVWGIETPDCMQQ